MQEFNRSEETIFAQARKEMIETQIKRRGIKDQRVLEAMFKVKRHKFVPQSEQKLAYEDYPLPIGKEQTISQPYIVALMTELLQLEGKEKVLEIGTGSGYQAAILAELANEVYTIEILEPLAINAEKVLRELDYSNVTVKCGDGYLGWEEYAPFDSIIVTCAPPYIPQPLIDQLAEGGKMVIPVGIHYQELKLLKKIKGKIKTTNIIPVRFVPMTRESDEDN
ncbi:protein-L-isoaspartate(D-aspartate) O-methyltransferase [bacterium]|nr:protein-L-isoaspartate(D-aspartate) O-methyltransferase [bacterium]